MSLVSIEAVLLHYGAAHVPVSDRWRPMRCPFHSDNQASASVNSEAGKFRCFACDFRGDGLDIVQWQEHIDDFTSAKQYAEAVIGASCDELPEAVRHRRNPLSDQPRHHKGQRDIFSARKGRRTVLGS